MPGETPMNCEDVRIRLLDYQRGRLTLPAQAEVRTHLNGCADCTRADAVEQELTSVLEHRLPQHPASLALRRRLAAEWPASATERSWWSRWKPSLVPAVAAAAVVLVAAPVLYYERAASRVASERAGMVAEAVNDHLRVLAAHHAQMIVHGLSHHAGPLARHPGGRALVIEDGRGHEHHRGGSHSRHEGWFPSAPPRAFGGGRGPLCSEPPPECKRGGVLGQTVLEHRRQLLLDGVGAGAVGAPVEVRAHFSLRRERQAAPLVVEQPDPHVLAVHRRLTGHSPSAAA